MASSILLVESGWQASVPALDVLLSPRNHVALEALQAGRLLDHGLQLVVDALRTFGSRAGQADGVRPVLGQSVTRASDSVELLDGNREILLYLLCAHPPL